MRPIFNRTGFPIRKSADQFIFADPRGLSQLITSFIASESQGIPRVPFLTFFYAYAFCSYGMLFESCCIFRIKIQEPRIKTEVSFLFLFSFFFRVTAVLYTVVFSFNLLLPICQRTFFRFAVLSLQFAVLTAYCPLFTAN